MVCRQPKTFTVLDEIKVATDHAKLRTVYLCNYCVQVVQLVLNLPNSRADFPTNNPHVPFSPPRVLQGVQVLILSSLLYKINQHCKQDSPNVVN